ncbi:squamosa promoter-binding-like protein 6 isoform X1 [Cannabis sativa]|uniref:SBP-type domain-containing protein n=1 Tax=Cannabis sativa TaxID=3483 RepID=A0A7J6FB15_CANSA|nr:squamosa promoter-binding-like protein 6 isoform X1 [Cannabis sativa]KAF4353556.1 hypothetical protein F8388_024361 [Cannabis sativa]KAF4367896.1 hypothetical protein G4B88_003896 [Cannabis sativa]
MESWNFAAEGKALLFSDDIDWSDAFSRNRKALIQCENGLVPGRESVESLEYMELGFPEMLRKTIQNSQGLEMLCGGGGEVGNGSIHRAASPACLISPNSSLVEDESGSNSKVSSSFMESNSQDSPLIALKLGRFGDCRNSQNNEHSKDKTVSSPSLVVKRARVRGSYSQTPFCQVHGCNMDLSTSKDYHKKHKVCDVHSKTSKVIVNGIEQRFCQQCSRFHLLAEFDDGKRSCRRRLAGHNERRRKPQLDGLSDKPHKFSNAYQAGTRYLGASLQKRTPFVFSDILPGVILSPEKYEQANQFGHIKFEEEPIYSPQLTAPVKSTQMFSKSLIHPHSSGVPSLENDDYSFHTAATIHKPYGASNSACALSLLSVQSHNFSSHSAGIPNESPMIIPGAHQTAGQLSEKPLRLRSMERHGQNGFYSCGTNSMGVDQFESAVFTESNHAADFEAADRSSRNSDCFDTKYSLSPEHESTVDLLQLSSHLQRVEHQRNFIPVKQENEDFCCFQTA